MKTILDEGVPPGLARRLAGHEISTVKAEGWRGIKNGKLLDLIEKSGFEVLITNDKRMEHEQDLTRRPFATLILSVTNLDIIGERIVMIQSALDEARPHEVLRIECGRFVPKRFNSSVRFTR